MAENLDDLQLSDMDDEDLIFDDPMAFVERQASQQNDVNTMFVDDSERAAKQSTQRKNQAAEKGGAGG